MFCLCVVINFQACSQNSEKRLLASSCRSVCLSVAPHGATQLALDGFFYETRFFIIFRKSVVKIPVSLKSSPELQVLYMKRNIHFSSYLAQFFLELEMFQTKFLNKIKTHFMFHNFLFFENHAFYEIMWKNVVQPSRLLMIIRRMRVACWIPNDTNTHSECVTRIAFPLQKWLHARASMLRYT